nr:MAG TPA: nucleic acid binding protein [Caudoviricetes sp.]
MAFKLKKRCVRCLKVLRDDGTCQNPNCCLYQEEAPKDSENNKTAGNATKEAK